MPEFVAPHRAGRPAARFWALVLAGLVVAPTLTGCIANTTPESSASLLTAPSLSASVPATSSPLETTQSSNKAPVYWLGRTGNGVFLYREFRDVPEQENPVTRALRAMMADKPLDADFFTPWQNPSKLATSISGKDTITVDLSEDAFNSNLDADTALRAVQQLVYTATAAAASSGLIDSGQQIRVRILVDGHTDYMAFGQVQLGALMTRMPGLSAPVWIIDPQENVDLAPGSVKITGRSTVAGGKLRWQILRTATNGTTSAFLTGETTAAADTGGAGLFSLSLTLPVGEYEAKIAQLGPDDQVDRNEETRFFSVK